jgi:DNA-binding response OmpR family regulator
MLSSLILIANEDINSKLWVQKLHKEDNVQLEFADSEELILDKVTSFEPDLILIANKFEDIDGFKLTKKIRELSCITRPTIVMVSNNITDDPSFGIEGLMSGADDYLHSTISDEEFSARIYAHLRRHLESLSNQFTHLPASNLVYTNLKRRINLQESWALMLINLNNYQPYDDTYGILASGQLLKAFLAIVKANVSNEDFIGHLGNQDFAVITNPLNVETSAERICSTFDQIIPKFYAPFEAKRGFTIITDEQRASRKIPLISVSAGIVTNKHRLINNYKTAISIANNMKDLAKYQISSGWLIDRPLLSGEEPEKIYKEVPYIIIVESDAALAYLLTTTIEMQGYLVDTTSSKDEAVSFISNKKPDLILIDAVMSGDDGWEVCNFIRQNSEYNAIKIIMATVLHDRDRALSSGADLYIPKPYDLMSLHRWINKLLSDN